MLQTLYVAYPTPESKAETSACIPEIGNGGKFLETDAIVMDEIAWRFMHGGEPRTQSPKTE